MWRSLIDAAGLLAAAAGAAELPDGLPKPGGIAVVHVADGPERPNVRFGDRPVLLMREDTGWYAVVGIPLSQPVEPTELIVATPAGGQRSVGFEIVEHAYREQRLNVERSYVEPDQAQLDRIFAERKEIDAALLSFREVDVDSLSLAAPVPGRRSPSFGFRRFFNDQPRSPHSGMDIAAVSGTPIVAPRPGVVTATGNYFFNGFH